MALPQVVQRADFQCRLEGNGRDEVTLHLTNRSTSAVQVEAPAGLIFATEKADRMLALRTASVGIGPGETAEIILPCAALSTKNGLNPGQPAHLTPDSEPRASSLLKHLATHNDVPRSTAQAAVLALMEDINFARWQTFMAARRQPDATDSATHPGATEIAEALDALGILKAIAPDRSFALASDPELKLRALRTPLCRAKAMQLYGMTIPGDAPAGQVPPDLGQLLHTKEGDNCPICRMRQQMQKPGNDL